ncbi:MAG: hypothetical protein K2L74_09730 [Muribaculaceae bacterium]|nr:hypothetical protein [Muribaculaceae bacterium]MDE6542281.1 hypothetical protein [Muribaculaceae bacterium]
MLLTKFLKTGLLAIAAVAAAASAPVQAHAQSYNTIEEAEADSTYTEVYRGTHQYIAPTVTEVLRDSVFDPTRVVTNSFGKNWFVFATGGVHSFLGDYSGCGKLSGTLSPDWSVGVGKWFTPGVGLKAEFIHSNSRGYTEYLTGHYGYGDIMFRADGTPYRRMKTRWWDVSLDVILNLTRLYYGYEGYDSRRAMNQFMLNLGLGGVHHLGFEHGHGSDNELSFHAEFQYSRFFTRSKRVSLDLKVRALFYQTNFDLEYGQANHAASKFDANVGVNLGFTVYLGKKRANGWGHGATKVYQRDYREEKTVVVRQKDAEAKPVQYRTLSFYVFYPNNYSGRNDAPQIAGADVNALDYLAGGIGTQKRFRSSADADGRIGAGISTNSLPFVDVRTTNVGGDFTSDYVPRGYEMRTDIPLSISTNPDSLKAFALKNGYYPAPIWDGKHQWHYRIDDATRGQVLLSDANYKETNTYGLNAHAGLPIVLERMEKKDGRQVNNDEIVSFADVYAALNGESPYLAEFTDSATVAHIRNVFNNGTIALIQFEGLATSQDNYTGQNARQVGIDRNNALSENRARTVLVWLQQHPNMKDVHHLTSDNPFFANGIKPVNDPSTRGLDAKLGRSVKVKIHYLIPEKK